MIKINQFAILILTAVTLFSGCKKEDEDPFPITGNAATCSFGIPANAIICQTSLTTGNGGETVWVCAGGTYTDDGGGTTVYLEENATFNSNGGGSQVYAKKGCTINCAGGELIHYINNDVTINTAGGEITSTCNSLEFDLTNAPAGGCQ